MSPAALRGPRVRGAVKCVDHRCHHFLDALLPRSAARLVCCVVPAMVDELAVLPVQAPVGKL
eukprot:1662073-Pyramimonas_sp.AAC.1